MAERFSLKDQLFNADKVGDLSRRFAAAGGRDAAAFSDRVMSRLTELELKQRIDWIAECLCAHLPPTLDDAAPILLATLPPPLDPNLADNDFGDFIHAPLGEVVVKLGLADAPSLSLDLFEEITQRFSMELSIRPFLNRWPEEVIARMRDWVQHPNYHVRRLVSEGTRPRLPWGEKVGLSVHDPVPFLDMLHADPTRYVTRSVANHLNDIARTNPELVLERLTAWRTADGQSARELSWMTSHALRGLVKSGDPRALELLGYDPDAPFVVESFRVPSVARIGESISIDVALAAPQPVKAMVDYVFHRRRADGGESEKVYKLGKVTVKPGQPAELAKSHPLKGDATTYRLHPGDHRISLQVNGRRLAEAAFRLDPT